MFKQGVKKCSKNVFLVRNVSFVKTRLAETRKILFPRRMEGVLCLIPGKYRCWRNHLLFLL